MCLIKNCSHTFCILWYIGRLTVLCPCRPKQIFRFVKTKAIPVIGQRHAGKQIQHLFPQYIIAQIIVFASFLRLYRINSFFWFPEAEGKSCPTVRFLQCLSADRTPPGWFRRPAPVPGHAPEWWSYPWTPPR